MALTQLDLDLANASVFLDFDGTITTADVAQHILERSGAVGWRDLDAAFVRGEISSRECLIDQWELLDPDEERLRSFAREIPVDEGVRALIGELNQRGAELTVVSDGFGFYAQEVCSALGVPVITNSIDFSTGRLEFPNQDKCCPCTSCGTCKQAPIRAAHDRGRTTVFVGDGASDRKAVLLADIVFAKAGLASWCEAMGIGFIAFETLGDVSAVLCGRGERS